VAVNVTGWPELAGFSEEANVVVVPAMSEILVMKASVPPPEVGWKALVVGKSLEDVLPVT
jgi:hypothetical protein